MATVAEIIGSSRAPGPNLVRTGATLAKSTFATPIVTNITVQGLNTIIEDHIAVAQFTHNASGGFVDFMGDFLAGIAKEIHRPHIRSGETFRSIGKTDAGTRTEGFGNWVVDVGPETQAARFLEFGFLHVRSGRYIQYPFMLPAADAIAPLFEEGMVQIVEVAANRRTLTGPAGASSAADALDGVRSRLYDLSKFAGDIAVFGFGGLSGVRGAALTSARVLGDIQSVMRGAISQRISFRVAGSFASSGLRANLSTTVSGPPGSFQGAAGRIYSRISGAAAGRSIGGIL